MTDATRAAITALEKVYAEQQARIAQLTQECAQIRRSIRFLGGDIRPRAKQPVYEFLRQVGTALTPQAIYQQMLAQGIRIRQGSLYNTLRRGAAAGDLIHDSHWNTYQWREQQPCERSPCPPIPPLA